MTYNQIYHKDEYLRDYQNKAKEEIFSNWDQHDNVMLQMPTGTGKTVLFSSIIKDIHNWQKETKQYQKILIIVHRTELITQSCDKLNKIYHIATGVIAGGYPRNLNYQVQVASIQTLTHPSNADIPGKLNVGFIIIDEAHHSTAPSYQKLWIWFPNAKKLGVTATPWRMNHAGFKKLFQHLILSMSVKEFIGKGYLANYQYYSIKPNSEEQKAIDNISEFDIEGDYRIGAMENIMDKGRIRAKLLDSYQKFAKGKKGIIYAITREHGKHICKEYSSAGVSIEYIDSNTKPNDRKLIVDKFKRGKVDVIVNVDIFSEGFDCPAIDFIQLARPTCSLVKYLQQVGRGLRPNGENKTIILDNVGMFKKFGFPNANRKWKHHFDGINVEDNGSDESSSRDYSQGMERFRDTSEGVEDMVLLNGEVQPAALPVETKEVKDIVYNPVLQMQKALDSLLIKYGTIFTANGLFFDIQKEKDKFVIYQIGIRKKYCRKPLLKVSGNSTIALLYGSFGPNFSFDIKVTDNCVFYFESGKVCYKLDNVNLAVCNDGTVSDTLNEKQLNHLNAVEEVDYNSALFNKSIPQLLENISQYNTNTEYLLDFYEQKGEIIIRKNIYDVYYNIFDEIIIEQVSETIGSNLSKRNVIVACGNNKSSLYSACKKLGAQCIKRIDHWGGKISRIICQTDSSEYLFLEFDGNTDAYRFDICIQERFNFVQAEYPDLLQNICIDDYDRYREDIQFKANDLKIDVYINDYTETYDSIDLCTIEKNDRAFKYLQYIDFTIFGWKKDKEGLLYLQIYSKDSACLLDSIACEKIGNEIMNEDPSTYWINVGEHLDSVLSEVDSKIELSPIEFLKKSLAEKLFIKHSNSFIRNASTLKDNDLKTFENVLIEYVNQENKEQKFIKDLFFYLLVADAKKYINIINQSNITLEKSDEYSLLLNVCSIKERIINDDSKIAQVLTFVKKIFPNSKKKTAFKKLMEYIIPFLQRPSHLWAYREIMQIDDFSWYDFLLSQKSEAALYLLFIDLSKKSTITTNVKNNNILSKILENLSRCNDVAPSLVQMFDDVFRRKRSNLYGRLMLEGWEKFNSYRKDEKKAECKKQLLSSCQSYIDCTIRYILPYHYVMSFGVSDFRIFVAKQEADKEYVIGEKRKVFLVDVDKQKQYGYASWNKSYSEYDLKKPLLKKGDLVTLEMRRTIQGYDFVYKPLNLQFCHIQVQENSFSKNNVTNETAIYTTQVIEVNSMFSFVVETIEKFSGRR